MPRNLGSQPRHPRLAAGPAWLARCRLWTIKLDVGLAKRPNALPNALVHSLYQRLLVLFGAAFTTMPIQESMPHQRAPATGAISKRSQGDPRWIFLGLFVRRHLWHDSGRRRFNNLHVALRVFFSIELDLLLPCELNASVLLGVLPLPDPLKILRNPSELLDFGATILGNMVSLHDQVVVPAGMRQFVPNPRLKASKLVRCIV